MDFVIALSQGLGLAVAAGLLASAPLALAATAAAAGWLRGPLGVADDTATVVVTWALVAGELVVDAVWPGAQAGLRLGRRVVAGGLAVVPFVGYALVAAAAGLLQRVRAREARKYEGLRVLR